MPVSGWNRDGSAREEGAAEDHSNEKKQRLAVQLRMFYIYIFFFCRSHDIIDIIDTLEFYCCCKWYFFLVI